MRLTDAEINEHLVNYPVYKPHSVLHAMKVVKEKHGKLDAITLTHYLLAEDEGGVGLGVLQAKEDMAHVRHLINLNMQPEMLGILYDHSGDHHGTIEIKTWVECGFLYIQPKGYGEPGAARGCGQPVFLELYEGKMRVVVHPDILNEGNQKIIDLEDAKEDRVTDWE